MYLIEKLKRQCLIIKEENAGGSLAKARAVLKTAFGEYSMWILLVLMYIIAGIFIPRLFYPENVQNIIVQGTNLGILSIGMTFSMLVGEIDLSVVATMGFAPLLGLFAINAGLPFLVAPLLTVENVIPIESMPRIVP